MRHILANLIVGAASFAFGLSIWTVYVYLRRFLTQSGPRRLLPLHIVTIGTSYAMLAFVSMVRVGHVNPRTPLWVYFVVLFAFVLGDGALWAIAHFVRNCGPRYRLENERRDRVG